MTRDEVLTQALCEVLEAGSLKDAINIATRALAESPSSPQIGVITASDATIAANMHEAEKFVKMLCQNNPGKVHSIVSIEGSYQGHVEVRRI